MAKKKNKKEKNQEQDKNSSIRVSERLKNFDIQINSLGEIISNYDIDKINDFLNKNVEDKKLVNRSDNLLDQLRSNEEKEGDNTDDTPSENSDRP